MDGHSTSHSDTNSSLPVDFNKVIAEVIAGRIDSLIRAAPQWTANRYRDFRNKTGLALGRYAECAWNMLSTTKTIVHTDHPVSLSQLFVPLDLTSKFQELPDCKFDELKLHSRHVLITAPAGSGKSTVFRYFFLEEISSGETIPIFVTLRDANSSSQEIITLATESINSVTECIVTESDVITMLAAGVIGLFLDGLDEVIDERRNIVTADIQRLARQYPHALIFVSSRPIEHASWEHFSCFRIKPLTLSQANELVKRLGINDDYTEKFNTDLNKTLFSTHNSFASNPLLLCLMRLMYSQNAQIPSNWNSFYKQAFSYLYYRHDASKPGGYSRAYKCQLDSEVFFGLFSALALTCLVHGTYSTDEQAWLSMIRIACSLTELPIQPEHFFHDLNHGVSLIIKDGLEFRFVHKSFVEFAAGQYFLRISSPGSRRTIREALGYQVLTPGFFNAVKSVDSIRCEEELLLPILEAIKDKIGGNWDSTESYTKFFALQDFSIAFNHEDDIPTAYTKVTPEREFYQFLATLGYCEPVAPTDAKDIEIEEEILRICPVGKGRSLDLNDFVEQHPDFWKKVRAHSFFGDKLLLTLQRLESEILDKSAIQESKIRSMMSSANDKTRNSRRF